MKLWAKKNANNKNEKVKNNPFICIFFLLQEANCLFFPFNFWRQFAFRFISHSIHIVHWHSDRGASIFIVYSRKWIIALLLLQVKCKQKCIVWTISMPCDSSRRNKKYKFVCIFLLFLSFQRDKDCIFNSIDSFIKHFRCCSPLYR